MHTVRLWYHASNNGDGSVSVREFKYNPDTKRCEYSSTPLFPVQDE